MSLLPATYEPIAVRIETIGTRVYRTQEDLQRSLKQLQAYKQEIRTHLERLEGIERNAVCVETRLSGFMKTLPASRPSVFAPLRHHWMYSGLLYWILFR